MNVRKFIITSVKVLSVLTILVNASTSEAQTYYPAGLPKSKINLWFDASDASSLTITSNAVSAWRDKVNNISAQQSSSAARPVQSTFAGKNVIEFNGLQGLDIADNNFLDPLTYNLAQVVYVYADASETTMDARVGTYSRNTFNACTPAVSVRYIPADGKYEFGSPRNNSGYMLRSFDDLRGQWNLFENFTASPSTTSFYTLNSTASIVNTGTYTNLTTPATLGNRYTNYANIHWGISETILTSNFLGTSGRKILNHYLLWKWGLSSKLPSDWLNLYNPISSTSFKNALIGIGFESASDSVSATGSTNGLGFSNINASSGFLHEKGDYLLAADNNLSGTIVMAASSFTRWSRTWFVDKTDAGNNGGLVNIYFDVAANNTVPALDTTLNNYYLLFNASDSTFSSGKNFIIPHLVKGRNGSQYYFTTDLLNVANGYYTLVYSSKSAAISSLPLYNIFTTPILSLKSPVINSVFSSSRFNRIFWSIDSLDYTPYFFKIYAGASANTLQLIDSITTSDLQYYHTNLTNGTTYYYAVVAGSGPNKESEKSNVLSATPKFQAPAWGTIPSFNTKTAVVMQAVNLPGRQTYKYSFECVSGGGKSSGWTNQARYIDSSLVYGNTYSYRYRFMDSTVANSESDWSTTVVVTLVDSAKGGFAYKFSFADNTSYIIPNGVGPSTYNATSIDTTGLRFIKHAPPFGVHPRLYCNPEDSTDIKWRLRNTASGRAVAKYIHANTVMLQWGFNPGNFSQSANYAKDTLGNQLFGNAGYTNEKPRYDSLAAGDIGVVNNVANGFNGYANKLANAMAYEAFECWLFKGTIDAVTNTSYTTRASRLANAITLWARKGLASTTKPVSFDNRDWYGSLQVAFIYDFLYDQMTQGQRDTVRMFVAALTPKDSTDLHLYNTPSYATITNWSTFGWEIWNILAIEGEQGYTQTHENTLQNYCRTVLNFLNYGFYSETGGPVEGIGKNQINVPMLVALAKRGYSLLGHPSVRNFGKKYYPAIMQPFGYSMLGTDLLGGTGNMGINGQYVTAAYGGWKHELSLDPIGYKWIYPNDTTIDFLWKNYIQKPSAAGITYPYTYYYQNFLGDAASHAGYWNFLYAAIFASDYTTTPLQIQAQKVYANNLMYFDSLGGFATLRSGFDSTATTLFYHNRTDLGGHTFANKNDIVYSALGRIWIPRVFTNANSNYPLASGTGGSSSILINGSGQSVDTSAAQNMNILPVPGRILQYQNNSNVQMIAGDATEAYSYQWSYLFGGYAGDNPLLGGAYTKVMKTLNSYRFARYYSFDDIPLYNKFTQGDYSWSTGPYYYRTVAKPWLNGILNKVYRTVALVTDAKPYAIITDDVQEDNTINNYKWVAQLANDLTIDSIVVNNSNVNFRNDIIFKEPTSTGNRRFLVRVLNNTGAINANVPVYIDSITNPINNVSPNNKLPRMVIESNSIDPKYKVLLFTYNQGEALPITTWNNDRSRLLITTTASTNTILFPVDSIGRTNIQILSGNLLPLKIDVNATLKNGKIDIAWQAYEQQDVATYTVEKSTDGLSFISITTRKASALTNDNYVVTDDALLEGACYYRIKMTYKNGEISYTKIVSIKFNTKSSLLVMPNPITSNTITLQVNGIKPGKYNATLVNDLGKNIANKTLDISNVSTTFQWVINTSLIDGYYHLILSSSDSNVVTSVRISKLK